MMPSASHVTFKQCSVLVGVSKAAVSEAVARGTLQPVVIAGLRMIPMAQVDAWAAKRRARLAEQLERALEAHQR